MVKIFQSKSLSRFTSYFIKYLPVDIVIDTYDSLNLRIYPTYDNIIIGLLFHSL